jgi:hypothetical protein
MDMNPVMKKILFQKMNLSKIETDNFYECLRLKLVSWEDIRQVIFYNESKAFINGFKEDPNYFKKVLNGKITEIRTITETQKIIDDQLNKLLESKYKSKGIDYKPFNFED